MPAPEKSQMLAEIDRCVRVVVAEITMLDGWAVQPDLQGNRIAGCVALATQLRQLALQPIQLERDNAAISEQGVFQGPSSSLRQRVGQREQNWQGRSRLNIRPIKETDFQDWLDDSQKNARAALTDARDIVQYCT